MNTFRLADNQALAVNMGNEVRKVVKEVNNSVGKSKHVFGFATDSPDVMFATGKYLGGERVGDMTAFCLHLGVFDMPCAILRNICAPTTRWRKR